MSFRKQQVESVLKRAISELLVRKISDPRIVGMVSITQVDVSPDLAQATVSVSVLPQQHERMTVAGLNHASPYIHGLVKKTVSLRIVPHLHFKLDHEIKKQSSVMAAINRGVAREGERAQSDDEALDDQGNRVSQDVDHSAPPTDPSGSSGQESTREE